MSWPLQIITSSRKLLLTFAVRDVISSSTPSTVNIRLWGNVVIANELLLLGLTNGQLRTHTGTFPVIEFKFSMIGLNAMKHVHFFFAFLSYFHQSRVHHLISECSEVLSGVRMVRKSLEVPGSLVFIKRFIITIGLWGLAQKAVNHLFS